MFKNQTGKSEGYIWNTETEEQPNGDILCSFCIKRDGRQTGIFFRKKVGESDFFYDETLSIEKFRD